MIRLILLLLAIVGGYCLVDHQPWNDWLAPDASARPARAQPLDPAPMHDAPASFADLAEKLSPAVVNISTTMKMDAGTGVPGLQLPNDPEFDPFREFFEHFGSPEGGMSPFNQEVQSLGSGFIIDPDGFIVTNNHVVEQASEITVLLQDDTQLPAEVVGRDPKTDLALLRVKAGKKLPYVKFGDSARMRVGDWVLAIGNPFGLGGTVTAGIISARSRSINAGPFDDFLQTDAAINRGNSGGPMFNLDGEVIGINTAIFSPTGGSIGIGFAVPSALAQPVLLQLKEFGRTHRGWLGVQIQEVTPEIADSVGLERPRGALVAQLQEGSPAGDAGLKPGDIILSFDGKPVGEMRMLPRIVAETRVGKEVEVEVLRGDTRRTLEVTLGELEEAGKEEEAAQLIPAPPEGIKGQTYMGMKLAPLNPALRKQLAVEDSRLEGLAVLDIAPESAAAGQDILPGDVILEVNHAEISTVAELRSAVERSRNQGRDYALLRVLRRGSSQFMTLPVRK